MTLKVVDRFTTQDGEWYVSNKPYSITAKAINKYGSQASQLGGASHIYVRYKPLVPVVFHTKDNNPENIKAVDCDGSGWANFPMWKSAAYWGNEGDGPWNVVINRQVVAEGLGLPEGFHVSTFLIVDDVDDSGSQPDTPVPPSDRQVIQVVIKTFINGELSKEEVVWQS